ncbi:MAG: WG repeat-containing protein [Brevinemataceae bacterium]
MLIVFLSLFFLMLSVDIYAQQLYPFPENGKWGYIDVSGKVVVSPVYEAAAFFSDGYARIAKFNDSGEYLYGFVNSSGKEIISPKFVAVSDFKSGLAKVRVKNQYSYLLANGTFVSKRKYDNIFVAEDGFSRYQLNNLYGYVNQNGEEITGACFSQAYNFKEGLALVAVSHSRKEQFGFINTQGTMIISPQYRAARSFSGGFAGVQTDQGWTFIDKNNNVVTDQIFEAVGDFNNGLAPVQIKKKWGYINTAGEFIIPPIYVIADKFSHGLAIVGNGRFFTFINKSGKELAPFVFTRAARFDGNLARVAKNNSNGFLNAQGRYNLTDKITSIGSFQNERSRMRAGNFYGYYASNGSLAVKPSYLYASDFKDELAVTIAPMTGGYKVSYINRQGSPIKSWSVISKPVPHNEDILFNIIYPSLSFYKDESPSSRVIIKAQYGGQFVKKYQKTATPIIGHGLNGLLYFSEYFARPGYIFSEGVSLFPVPNINMGIYPYFRDRFGVISETGSPTEFQKSMSSIFFNGATLSRNVNRNSVIDTYFVPFMKVSEAFFIFSSAAGFPTSEYPKSRAIITNLLISNAVAQFNGRKDSSNNPQSFMLSFNNNRERIEVSNEKYGITMKHWYNVPFASGSVRSVEECSGVFVSDNKNQEVVESVESVTNQLVEQFMINNGTNTLVYTNETSQIEIIRQNNVSNNTVDMTDAVIQDALNNKLQPNNTVQTY